MGKIRAFFLEPYETAFIFLAFVLPLIYGTPTNELYEFPKMFFVYFVGGLIITAFALEYVIKNKPLHEIPIHIKLYLLLFLVSTFFSQHLYTSVWGYYTRFNDSLISTLVFFGLYVVAKEKLNTNSIDKVFMALIFSTIPISIVGITQHSDLLRVFSTFGQPNWLGQYLAIILLYMNYLLVANSSNEENTRSHYGSKNQSLSFQNEPLLAGQKNLSHPSSTVVVWFVLSVLGFTCLWLSYSLSGVLAYFVGLLVFVYLYKNTLLAQSQNRYKLLLLILVYGLIALANLGVFRLRILDVFGDVKNLLTSTTKVFAQTGTPTIQRNLSDTGFIRGGLWKATLLSTFASPKTAFIGTGPETYPYAFQKYRPPELNYSSEWNFVFNKPHNYFLEIAFEQGLMGLAAYLYLCGQLIKNLDKKYLPSFIAFGVSNIFGWPTVATTFIFWLWLSRDYKV